MAGGLRKIHALENFGRHKTISFQKRFKKFFKKTLKNQNFHSRLKRLKVRKLFYLKFHLFKNILARLFKFKVFRLKETEARGTMSVPKIFDKTGEGPAKKLRNFYRGCLQNVNQGVFKDLFRSLDFMKITIASDESLDLLRAQISLRKAYEERQHENSWMLDGQFSSESKLFQRLRMGTELQIVINTEFSSILIFCDKKDLSAPLVYFWILFSIFLLPAIICVTNFCVLSR